MKEKDGIPNEKRTRQMSPTTYVGGNVNEAGKASQFLRLCINTWQVKSEGFLQSTFIWDRTKLFYHDLLLSTLNKTMLRKSLSKQS